MIDDTDCLEMVSEIPKRDISLLFLYEYDFAEKLALLKFWSIL